MLPHPATLLCESCGYVVQGLDESANCPECGRPIAESLPERRTGSPAQQVGGLRACAATWWLMMCSPRRTFGLARIEPHLQARLWLMQAAAAIWTLPMLVALGKNMVMVGGDARLITSMVFGIPGALLCWQLTWIMLMALTAIEQTGVQFFGRLRGWRVTRDVAISVCSHASAGWVTGAIISTLCALYVIAMHLKPRWVGRSEVLAFIVLGQLAGLVIGLLWFEILVYVGVRRCRFANQAR